MTNKRRDKKESNQPGASKLDMTNKGQVNKRVTNQETSKLDMTNKGTGKQESNQSGD